MALFPTSFSFTLRLLFFLWSKGTPPNFPCFYIPFQSFIAYSFPSICTSPLSCVSVTPTMSKFHSLISLLTSPHFPVPHSHTFTHPIFMPILISGVFSSLSGAYFRLMSGCIHTVPSLPIPSLSVSFRWTPSALKSMPFIKVSV